MTNPGENSQSAPSSRSGHVIVIALDGATWDLARPWMEAGHLPNLARLVASGASAEMQAELPPSSVPNWPAFMTGKNAARHGCPWWLQRDAGGRLDRVPIDSHSVQGDTLWSYASAHGKKVIVQNVPVTYPVEPVNGVLISGLLTPRTAGDFVYPPELKPQLDAAVGGYQIYPQGGYAHGREQAYLEALLANIRLHAQAADWLLRNHDWDFFMLVLGPTDEGAHKYWHYMDPAHHLYRPEEATRFGDSIRQMYTAADEAIGLLSAHAAEGDTVIVMSDHGFGPVERFFLPNNWLMQHGYLRLKSSGVSALKRLLFKLGFTPRNVYPLGKQALSLLRGGDTLRQRLDPARQGQSPLRKIFLSDEDIDWTHTRAFATGFLCSQIYLNLRGREPQGVVPQSEYHALRERLVSELAALPNPEYGRDDPAPTGKPHYARVYRREELYTGPLLENMPDLLCLPADFRTVDSGIDFRSNKLFETDSALTGTHRVQGIFVARGPGMRCGEAIPPIRIYDLAPTILHRLGLPVPDDMDGRVIEAALAPGELAAHPVRFGPAGNRRRAGNGATSEDDATVIERLRDLGYLS